MTLLDDDIDDLLRAFRADEAAIDDMTRARMWDRICTDVPDASTALDGLVPHPAAHRSRRRVGGRPRTRVLAIAAAVLVLLAVAGAVIGSGPDDDSVTAGPAPTAPLPRTLDELADAVARRPVPELGATADTRYAYQRYQLTVHGTGQEPVTRIFEQWVARDGSGQYGPTGELRPPEGPGAYGFAGLDPETVLGLPDDPAVVATAFDALVDYPRFGPDIGPGLVEVLAYPGLPAPARAGLIRSLDVVGFVPLTAPDLAPTLVRVEGPGPAGSTMQADLDLLTGEVRSSARIRSDGSRQDWVFIEADLRADLRGS